MEDYWNGAAHRGSGWGASSAVPLSTRPAVPWKPAGETETRVRFLLAMNDDALAQALLAGLRQAGHDSMFVLRLPLPGELASVRHDVLLVDERLLHDAAADWLDALRLAGIAAPVLFLGEGEAKQPPEGTRIDVSIGVDGVLGALLGLAEPIFATAARRWLDGQLAIDMARQAVRLSGVAVELTPLEWQVIALLSNHADRAVPRAELARLIGGGGNEASDNAVAVHLYNLRRKLGRHAIETIRGRGFRLKP